MQPFPDVVLRLPADTVGTFFLRAVASFIRKVERAVIKANSSCLSMTLRQGHPEYYTTHSFGSVLL